MAVIDIEVFQPEDIQSGKAQAKYLVHGVDDVMWTDDLVTAIMTFTQSLRKLGNEPHKDCYDGFCADCGERCDYCPNEI